jgi:hypothetical protein
MGSAEVIVMYVNGSARIQVYSVIRLPPERRMENENGITIFRNGHRVATFLPFSELHTLKSHILAVAADGNDRMTRIPAYLGNVKMLEANMPRIPE